ncbi:MAG TPA: DUF2934 domain-containing protein [Phycisphaerae bacterium]|jgi:hypothetical protein|nr:DUF2934 domain-containing protein [Phycisphaerae bacterium]
MIMIANPNDRWGGEIDGIEETGENVVEHASRLPTHDEIERRAYEVYLRRGGEEGHCEEDWLEAERELLEEMHNSAAGGPIVSIEE